VVYNVKRRFVENFVCVVRKTNEFHIVKITCACDDKKLTVGAQVGLTVGSSETGEGVGSGVGEGVDSISTNGAGVGLSVGASVGLHTSMTLQ
jgi:hypothetical protein